MDKPAAFGTEARAQNAFDWLVGNATAIADARAREKAEELKLSTVRAFLENNAPEEHSTQAARERWAKTQPSYLDQIAIYEEAVKNSHRLFIMMKAAEMAVSAWQTKSKNERVRDGA
jgi:hypothetical protein